ncbi:MAG: YggT family protein [Treponema sp.]|nr:YggT family protein [Treponema sp.]
MVSILMFLAGAVGLYSLLIVIRIIFTWFVGIQHGKPLELLSRITDPYLNWWRNALNLKVGFLDLTPIAAMTFLSMVQSILTTLARHGRISLGIILAVALSAIWSALSFILGFCLLIIILRLIAYVSNRNIYSPFWRTVDTISQPLLYKINSTIFGDKIVNYLTRIFVAIGVLAAIMIGGRIGIPILAGILIRLPL